MKTNDDAVRLLVCQVNHVGDFATALPLLDALRRHLPDAHLTLVTSPSGEAILGTMSMIDEVIVYPSAEYRKLWRHPLAIFTLWQRLRRRKFTVAINVFDECSTSHLVQWLARIPIRIGYRGLAKASFLLNRFCTFDHTRHVIENSFDLVDALHTSLNLQGMPSRDIKRPDLRFSDDEEIEFKRRFKGAVDTPFILIHPFAKSSHKEWPVECFVQLIELFTARFGAIHCIVVSNGRPFPTISDRFSLLSDTSLRELMWLIGKAKAFVGNNSGPMNLAVTMGTPTISIDGPSSIIWNPYPLAGTPVSSVTAHNLFCLRCEERGSVGRCERNLAVSECMTLVTPTQVMVALQQLLERAGGTADAV